VEDCGGFLLVDSNYVDEEVKKKKEMPEKALQFPSD
jgi:hypothetical protein